MILRSGPCKMLKLVRYLKSRFRAYPCGRVFRISIKAAPKLVKALKDNNSLKRSYILPSAMNWQSIFRFARSDIHLNAQVWGLSFLAEPLTGGPKSIARSILGPNVPVIGFRSLLAARIAFVLKNPGPRSQNRSFRPCHRELNPPSKL